MSTFAEEAIPVTEDMSEDDRNQAISYNRAMQAQEDPVNQNRVIVEAVAFEVDAYSAAVGGIMQSVRLGYTSGSIGVGGEQETLRRVWELLVQEDEALSAVPTPW